MSLIKKSKSSALTEGNTLFETIYEISLYLLFSGYFLFYDTRSLQIAFVGIGLGGAVLICASKAYLSRLKVPLNTIWYFIFFILAEVSALWAYSPENAVSSYLRLMIFLLVICLGITQYVDTTAQAERILKIFVFSALTLSLVQFAFTPVNEWFNGFLGSEVGGNNTNNFGYTVAMSAISAFYFAYVKNLRSYYIYTVIFITCCLLSSSRKSLILSIIGIIFLILFAVKKKNRFWHLLLITVFASTSFMLLFEIEILYNIIGKRFESMLEFYITGNTTSEGSISLRVYFIEFAKILLEEKPAFGHGFANFLTVIASESNLNMGYAAHNNYWEILSDLGIVGFIVYYWFYVYLLIKLVVKLIKEKENTITSISLAMLATQLIFEYNIVTMSSFYPQIVITLIYVCSYASYSKRKYHYSPKNMR